MEMIDILQKLREYQEAGHKIDDAIANVEKTNPTLDEDANKKELHAKLKDLKSKYNAQMAGAYAGDPDATEAEIEKIEKQLGISKESKDMKKEKMNEAIQMTADTPEEAGILMQILKLAGVKPVDAKMMGAEEPQDDQEHDDDCGCDHKEEAFANEPDEKTQSVDDLVNTHSGGLNRKKHQFAKAQDGDNAMAVEALANSLRDQYASFKEAYDKAADDAKKK